MRLGIARRPKPASPVTIGALVDDWLAGKRGLSTKGATAAAYAAELVTARWGTVDVTDIRTHDLQAWVAGMGLSVSARHKALQAVSGAVRIGVERGLLVARNAADGGVSHETRREGLP